MAADLFMKIKGKKLYLDEDKPVIKKILAPLKAEDVRKEYKELQAKRQATALEQLRKLESEVEARNVKRREEAEKKAKEEEEKKAKEAEKAERAKKIEAIKARIRAEKEAKAAAKAAAPADEEPKKKGISYIQYTGQEILPYVKRLHVEQERLGTKTPHGIFLNKHIHDMFDVIQVADKQKPYNGSLYYSAYDEQTNKAFWIPLFPNYPHYNFDTETKKAYIEDVYEDVCIKYSASKAEYAQAAKQKLQTMPMESIANAYNHIFMKKELPYRSQRGYPAFVWERISEEPSERRIIDANDIQLINFGGIYVERFVRTFSEEQDKWIHIKKKAFETREFVYGISYPPEAWVKIRGPYHQEKVKAEKKSLADYNRWLKEQGVDDE